MWKLVGRERRAKFFSVWYVGTDQFLRFDYDDVDHDEVDAQSDDLVALLNEHRPNGLAA